MTVRQIAESALRRSSDDDDKMPRSVIFPADVDRGTAGLTGSEFKCGAFVIFRSHRSNKCAIDRKK